MPLLDRVYELVLERFENRVTGSVFAESERGISMGELPQHGLLRRATDNICGDKCIAKLSS